MLISVSIYIIDLIHKSHNAPVPYPTMHHSGQKCTHFCFELCIVGYTTGALWGLWDWLSAFAFHSFIWLYELIEAEWRIHTSVKYDFIGSYVGLSPVRRQAIIWTNAGLLAIGTPWTNFRDFLFEIQTFSFKLMHLNMLSGKLRPFCLGLNPFPFEYWIEHFNFGLLFRRGTVKQSHNYMFDILENYHSCTVGDLTALASCRGSKF